MEDRDFFDTLYQLWSKTTGAQDRYWDYHEGYGTYSLNAVGEDGKQLFVGSFDRDEDADFVTAIHGCLPDLVRRLHSAVDESDASVQGQDANLCRIFELELELQEFKQIIQGLSTEPPWTSRRGG